MIRRPRRSTLFPFFFFNDTATTEIYTLSLHDALPIYGEEVVVGDVRAGEPDLLRREAGAARDEDLARRYAVAAEADRKSTRLNSSHLVISYAVFCLKKKIQ